MKTIYQPSKNISNTTKRVNPIATNLIDLSNIQYLLKYVNFIQHDPSQIFNKCLKQIQANQQDQLIGLKLKSKLQIVPYTKFNISNNNNNDDINDHKQFTFDNMIRKQLIKSLQIKIPKQPLSKQQLLHMGYTKISQQKQQSQKQISRSRRSFQYIQGLKQKISLSSSLQSYIGVDKQYQSSIMKQHSMRVQEMLQMLSKLQEQRYYLKMGLYHLQKEENTIKQQMKVNLYQLLQGNLIKSRQLYTLCMSQSRVQLSIKSQLLLTVQNSNNNNKISNKSLSNKGFTNSNNRQIENVNKLQKLLNSILLDQRQLQLLKYQLKNS